ncbi:hypothetical protein B0181_01325 [Moraxella caviae]|uniref:DUF2281 domain-containing protein n=1 Tax=Moraxella caviae TaxID=34060 RepID=A0A1T0AAS4_9GAMM|nr:hypothetical protein [Moraxella caviae]OOR92803.1 hypothetical protein B0181_01325 [Moraxella caviae]STZ14159.1 Uncharacterised protein [Moraxella caviae]VEW12605.1 Uncharacterised protein [Moraxella caviae]
MTALILRLPDDIVANAKTLGVFDEKNLQTLAEQSVLNFLKQKISQNERTPQTSTQTMPTTYPLGMMQNQIVLHDDFDEPIDDLFECLTE